MKFGRRFDNSKIPEWADFYVSYRVLKKLLSPYKFVSQCKRVYYFAFSNIQTIYDLRLIIMLFHYTISQLKTFRNQSISARLSKNKSFTILKRYEHIFQLGSNFFQVLAFFNIKLNQIITKWRKLRINLVIYKQRSEALTDEVKNENSSMLKVYTLAHLFFLTVVNRSPFRL